MRCGANRSSKIVQDRVKSLRASAKIEYQPGFRPAEEVNGEYLAFVVGPGVIFARVAIFDAIALADQTAPVFVEDHSGESFVAEHVDRRFDLATGGFAVLGDDHIAIE